MSISMKFVPYALALRHVMGQKQYDTWTRAREKICETCICDEDMMRNLVVIAGMDWISYGKVRKTHMGNTYFFWQHAEQHWQAVFSVEDNPTLVAETMNRLQNAYNGMLWIGEPAQKQPFFATEFTDEGLLKRSLSDCGLPYQVTREGELLCADGMLKFREGADGIFYLSAHTKDFDKAFHQFSVLDDCYRQHVQDRVYANLIEDLQQQPNAHLLDERIEADNTIVLTIQMP